MSIRMKEGGGGGEDDEEREKLDECGGEGYEGDEEGEGWRRRGAKEKAK